MEAERKRALAEIRASSDPHIKAPQLREVPDMLSWLQCFSLFAGIVISKHPEKAKELLAYQALMIYEARRIGGRGWAQYDACFRQQIQSLSSANFGTLNQSLYSTTFLAMRGFALVAREQTTCMRIVPSTQIISAYRESRCRSSPQAR